MFKIDDETANSIEPLRSGDGPNVGGAFDEALETKVTDEWLNAVQNEISNVVEMNGGTLDKQDDTQLFSMIRTLFTGMALSNWQEQSNPQNRDLYSVVYGDLSVTGQRFIAVGQTNGTKPYIIYSDDGVNWTEQSGFNKSASLNDAIIVNGWCLAVGNVDGGDALIVRSNTGAGWTEVANPKNFSLNGIAYGGGLFAAVGNQDGSDAYIITSPDGINWTERSNPKNVSLFAVTYANGLFVAVGNNDGSDAYIVTSTDGITWTERANPHAASLSSVTYANGLFVAAGYHIITSPDGINWSESKTLDFIANEIIYANGTFVVVGQFNGGGNVLTSLDGITWTERRNPDNSLFHSIAFGVNTFVTVGAADGADASIYTSLRLG